MKPVEVLKHLAEVCVRNEDGSLSLGTHEVEMIEESIKEFWLSSEDTITYYGGWCSKDVVDSGQRLGYEIPEDVAEEIIDNVTSKDCEVTWEKIDFAIENHYNIEEYRIDNETVLDCFDEDE